MVMAGNTKGGSISVPLTSCLTDLESAVLHLTNFCFYLQNRLIQTSQTGGQQYSDTSPLVFPGLEVKEWITVKYSTLVSPIQTRFKMFSGSKHSSLFSRNRKTIKNVMALTPGAVFTRLYLLCNLQLCPISLSVCSWQAFPV